MQLLKLTIAKGDLGFYWEISLLEFDSQNADAIIAVFGIYEWDS